VIDRDLSRPPVGSARPDWVAAQAATASLLPAQTGGPETQVSPGELRRRRVELALASKLLDAHLRNRLQLMQSDPADLTGLSQPETVLLIRAMIAAAHADGRLGEEERARLSALVQTRIEDATTCDWLTREMDAPPSVELLARSVESSTMAERFYAVSAEVAGFDRPANRTYLAYLAARLDIAADVVLRINRKQDGHGASVRKSSG